MWMKPFSTLSGILIRCLTKNFGKGVIISLPFGIYYCWKGKKIHSGCINEAAVKAAKEFFSTKIPRNFHEISALHDDILNEVCFHQELSPKEVAQLMDFRKKYGEDDFFNHLGEVFEDEDVIHDFTCGDDILGIDLDAPMRKDENIVRSMSRAGTPTDNPVNEALNGWINKN